MPAMFRVPTHIVAGEGCSQQLGHYVARYGKHAFVIVDKVLVERPEVTAALETLRQEGISFDTFTDTQPNPDIPNVERAMSSFSKGAWDCVVAIGGGSSIDLGKAVAILATNDPPISRYAGTNKLDRPNLPVIAMPTTAGTGSEVTMFSVITDPNQKIKMSIGAESLTPVVAILDPVLTQSLPPAATASTGVDALTHAIESYLSKMSQPATEALALKAIDMISKNLRICVADGSNIYARYQMLMASTMAGIAFTNTRLGIVHAMTNVLGGHYPIPHGVANAVVLPYAMEFNWMAAPEKFKTIAEIMGEDTSGLPLDLAARKAIDAVKRLVRDVGIPRNLVGLGVNDSEVEVMAKEAVRSANAAVNCRMATVEQVVHLYQRAILGSDQAE